MLIFLVIANILQQFQATILENDLDQINLQKQGIGLKSDEYHILA